MTPQSSKLLKLDAVSEDSPDQKSQRQDIVRLLVARQSGLRQQLQQQQGTTRTTTSAGGGGFPAVSAAHGEALFLIDWQWWSKFCEYIDFFCWKQPKQKIPAIQAQLLSYFPHGASVPSTTTKPTKL